MIFLRWVSTTPNCRLFWKPEEESDFSQYEEHLFLTVERDHAFFQVKIPIRVKDDMKCAVGKYAKKHSIKDKDEAMLAGKVFASLCITRG